MPEPPDDALTAEEAAARLGIKKATLYAYVSRGLLTRVVAADGRRSLFRAPEVDALRRGRRRVVQGEIGAWISTGLTRVTDGGVSVRGRDLVAMVASGARFEQVFAWLFDVEAEDVPADGACAARVRHALDGWPDRVGGIERLRVACAVASAYDDLRYDLDADSVVRAARRLLLAMVESLPVRGAPAATGGLADRLWGRLTERAPESRAVAALDGALGLLVDHGLATSTFAARLAASVRADPYSIVAAGLGAVAGTLHGAASREVHRLFAVCADSGDVSGSVGDARRRSGRYPGMGHAVHLGADPRCDALLARVEDAFADDARLDVVREVREVVTGRNDARCNVDFALGALTWLADMPSGAGELVFAIARTSGWLAHGLEEFREKPVRFRPVARYTGP